MVSKTVYVVGAGASSEYGLPLGSKLKKSIADALRRTGGLAPGGLADTLVAESLQLQYNSGGFGVHDFSVVIDTAAQISEAMAFSGSIDNYVHAHSNDRVLVAISKMAIAYCIMFAEHRSSLYSALAERNRDGVGGWLEIFFHRLSEGATFENFVDRLSRIGLIVFNYDRCVEYYLLKATQSHFRVSEQAAFEALQRLAIAHPYGHIGGVVPDPADVRRSLYLPFGSKPNSQLVTQAAARIKTFSEGIEADSVDFKKMVDMLGEAASVVFLGFGYGKLNVELIQNVRLASPMMRNAADLIGTALGVSEYDIEVLNDRLAKIFGSLPRRCILRDDPSGCRGLIAAFSQKLSF